MMKEDLVPDQSTKFVFLLAPMIAVVTAIMAIIVYPFGPTITIPFLNWTFPLVIARFDVALLYVLGVTSVGVYGIALAGWSSNNKYSLMGGLRSSAQMISYELALGLSLIGVVLICGTLDIYDIVQQQSGWFGLQWNIIYQPLGFILYLIAAIAETNRVPFDLPEAETELVAGFHTEYSSIKFLLFFQRRVYQHDYRFDAGDNPVPRRLERAGRGAVSDPRSLLFLREDFVLSFFVHLAARYAATIPF